MENQLINSIEKLKMIQKRCKFAINKAKRVKIYFTKGDYKKVSDEINSSELENAFNELGMNIDFKNIKKHLESQRSKLRIEFDSKFIEECKILGMKNILGNSMEEFRINGILHVKVNFSKNICEIFTFAKSKKLKSIEPKLLAKECHNEYKRLFSREFNPKIFLRLLYDAYNQLKSTNKNQLFLKEIHQALWIKSQSQSFFEQSEPSKMVSYPIDEFSVDISRLLESKTDRTIDGNRCKLLLGRDGVNIYAGDGSFNSYKFIDFSKGGDSHD